jgi:DNA-binding transcriptional MocR family regulator
VLRLPPGVSDSAITDEARSDGIAVTPLSALQLAPTEAGGLVIGYGRLHEAAIEDATEALAKVVKTQMRRSNAERRT